MADTKISDLPANTTPGSSAVVAVVESNTTSKSTLRQLMKSTLGWFDVGHAGSNQSSLGTTETKLLVDGADTNQGGYDYLPEGISSSNAYDSSTSKIKLGWLDEGQAVLLRTTGNLTTDTANTVVTLTYKFFNSSDVEIFSHSDTRHYKSSGSYDFSHTHAVWLSSVLAVDGYCTVHIKFDVGTNTAVDMGGFFLSVLS